MTTLPARITDTLPAIQDRIRAAIAGTHDERVEVGTDLVNLEDGATWVTAFGIGDLANAEAPPDDAGYGSGHGERGRFTVSARPETVKDYADAIGKAGASVTDYAWVAERWPAEPAGTKTTDWITNSEDPAARTRTYTLPYRRPGVSYGVHRVLASLPEADRHEAMERLLSDYDGSPTYRAAMEEKAQYLEPRTAAANAADARTPASVKQHGATPGNETEQAYEARLDQAVRQGERDKAAEDRLYEARDWEKVDDTTSYSPPPARRLVGNLDNVPGMVRLLDDIETAVANLDYLGEREAGQLQDKLLSVSEMVTEVQRISQAEAA